jgi:hypothetical protein
LSEQILHAYLDVVRVTSAPRYDRATTLPVDHLKTLRISHAEAV